MDRTRVERLSGDEQPELADWERARLARLSTGETRYIEWIDDARHWQALRFLKWRYERGDFGDRT